MLHVRAWQVAYRGLLPDAHLDALDARERAARYDFDAGAELRTTLALAGDVLCGFVTTGPCRDADRAGVGELCALHVAPDRWGTGVGRVLIEAARAPLAQVGFADASLWVLTSNARARRFYEIDGWAPDGASQVGHFAGGSATELRYHRKLP